MSYENISSVKEAKETFQSLMELSRLLCTGLEPDTLAICVQLCEAGINPELLAIVLRELTKEVQGTQDQNSGNMNK